MNANRRRVPSHRTNRSLKPRNAAMSRLVALVFVAGVLGAFAPGRGQAQSSIPREETWVTDGPVYAIARTADTVYIGGNFTYVGPLTGGGAPLDVVTGWVQAPFLNVKGSVWVCVADGAGGWFIGGSFGGVGDLERNGVAHILSDGSVDPAWNPDANGGVSALAVSGPTVYAGGGFTSIGGESRNCIAALDAATGNATAWNPSASSWVYTLAVSGSTVYAGGVFTTIGGQTRWHIAALDAATGNATPWDPNASDWAVYALAVSGSTVYAGGDFDSIGGQSRNGIAALDAATGNATSWDPNPDAGGNPPLVDALAVSGSTVYAGGDFDSIGGQSRVCIAALNAATGSATAWNPNASGYVRTLAVSGSTVYAGGDFAFIGGQSRNRIAALDATTGNATAWNPDASGGTYGSHPHVYALAVSGSTVYAGGTFTSIGGQTRNYIAALDAATGSATVWNPDASNWVFTPEVSALAVSGSTVYVGGNFTTIGGQSRKNVTALDAATGNATAWNPNAGGDYPHVSALAVSGSTVYAGGSFTSIGGQSRNRIAALDAATGNATAWNPSADGTVSALAISGSTIYAGGGFTSIGGQLRNYIAALDAATGNATAWDPNAGGSYPWVNALAVSGSKVYVVGRFMSIGGQSRNRIAALDAATGNATAWNPNTGSASPYVNALAVSGSTVYVGGDFCRPRPYFAQFDTPPPAAADIWPLY